VPTGVCAKATSRPLAASVAWRQRSAPAPIVGCSPRTRHITTFRARPMRACGSSMKQSNPDIRTTGSAAVAAHGACLASPTAVAITANPVSSHPIPIARIPASPTSTQPHSSVVLNGSSGDVSHRQGTRNPGRCAMPYAASRAGIAYRTSRPPSATSKSAYPVPSGTLEFLWRPRAAAGVFREFSRVVGFFRRSATPQRINRVAPKTETGRAPS